MKFNTIISARHLEENLDTADWIILDCRNGVLNDELSYKKYDESHIPSAFYCQLSVNHMLNLSDNPPSSSLSSTDLDKIVDSLKENGFNQNSQIVIYDNDDESSFSESIWLFLRAKQCQNVAVLQGGFAAWLEQEMPLTLSSDKIVKEVLAEIH